MRKENFRREIVLYIMIAVLVFSLVGRAFYLQVVKGDYYNLLSQYRSIRIVEVPSMRGKILDKSGVVLAEDLPSYNVGITLEDVEDLDKELITLSSIISVSPDQMKERLDKADLPSYELVVVKTTLQMLKELKLRKMQMPFEE